MLSGWFSRAEIGDPVPGVDSAGRMYASQSHPDYGECRHYPQRYFTEAFLAEHNDRARKEDACEKLEGVPCILVWTDELHWIDESPDA